MDIVKKDLWSTPVWEIDTGFDDYFNQVLYLEISDIIKNNERYNIWEFKTPSITRLKDKIFECLDNTVAEYFNDEYPYEPVLLAGWGSRTKPGESLHLHGHDNCILVATYYIKCPANSGDLLLVDPRGHVNWGWERETKPPTINCIKYTRVQPVPGKLVIFPGYVMHMVETNMSDEPRFSVSCNIQNGRIPPSNIRK
jgi:uncharacterized protein (TIGR02466 family)